MAIFSVGMALATISSAYANEVPCGPGYEATVITSETVENPGANWDILDEIESKKFRVTGYSQSQFKELTELMEYIYNAEPGVDGYISYWIDRNVCSIQQLSEFMTFNYCLSGQLPVWHFRTHSNRPNEYEIRVDYAACKDVIDKHNEAERLIAEKINGRAATLETVQQLYAEVVNNTTYDRTYETYTTAYDVLVNHQSTCHGIAILMNKMLEQLGIESYYVVGNTSAGYHAWNTCIVDGNAYTYDATYALNRKGTDRMWNTFKADSSMTLGDGRTIQNIY